MLHLGGGLLTTAAALGRGFGRHLRSIPLRNPHLCIDTQPETAQILKNTLRHKIVPSVSEAANETARRVVEVRAQRSPALPHNIATNMLTCERQISFEMRNKQAISNGNAKQWRFQKRCKKVTPRLGKQPRRLEGAFL